jgi:hypothetical protein
MGGRKAGAGGIGEKEAGVGGIGGKEAGGIGSKEVGTLDVLGIPSCATGSLKNPQETLYMVHKLP